MKKLQITFALLLTAATAMSAHQTPTATTPATAGAVTATDGDARVARGKYLVSIMGCNDCHTPLKLGPNGPEPDMSRFLTGHPENFEVPAAPELPAPWMWTAVATNTAFAGPWGTSFTANLTPDKETGLGDWTVEQFIATMKTGRHQGKGRQIKPPMPWFVVGNLNDEDIRSLFAFLQSMKPVHNRVPAPIDPAEKVPATPSAKAVK